MRRAIPILMLAVVLMAPFSVQPTQTQAASCEFVLGFKAIHDMIPDIVGDCLVNEHHNPVNGDGLQETTAWHGKGGLLVWRKADNWTAFTDGANTWINGPNGLQKRPNEGPCFSWEVCGPQTPGPTATTVPQQPGQPTATPVPQPTKSASTPPPGSGEWATHNDAEKTFQYPKDWRPARNPSGSLWGYVSQDGRAAIFYQAPYRMGGGFKVEEFLISWVKGNAGDPNLIFYGLERSTINGFPAAVQSYEIKGRQKGLVAAIINGANVYVTQYAAVTPDWDKYESWFRYSLSTFVPKSGG